MHFWKSTLAFLGTLFVGACIVATGAEFAQATASLNSTYAATVSTATVGTIRHLRIDQANGKIYIPGSSLTSLGEISADGNTFSAISYSPALATSSLVDFAVSNTQAYVSISGAGNFLLYRYSIDGSVATYVASSTLTSGTTALTLGDDGTVYNSRSTTVNVFDASLGFISSTTAVTVPARLAYGGGKLFYISTAGRFSRLILDGSGVAINGVTDIAIMTGGPTSATIKGLVASNDGSALYYASTSVLGKISVSSGTILWTRSISNIAGIDIDKATGRILVVNTSGVVSSYDPINPATSFSASVSGADATLNWSTGASSSDFAGVTIRRGTSSYPTSVTDGSPVTSTNLGSSFTDSGLSDGTYYYTIFNGTSDEYYSSGVTSTVTIAVPPSAPLLSAGAVGSSIYLAWSVPSDTDSFVLRRSTDDFPATQTDGTAVTTTASSITGYGEFAMPDGTYYYSIFAVDAEGNYSASGTASVTVDTVAPVAPVLSVIASSSDAYLSWDTPPTTDLFVLRRSTTAFPTTISQGVAVTSTLVTELVDASLSDNTYYYSIFARDFYNNFSVAGTASVVIDTTPPSAPVLVATVSSSNVFLSWDVPATTDSFLLRRSLSSFPTSISDGTAVTSTIATTLTNAGLSDGTYYYSIFARDSYGNYSVAGTASASIDTTAPSAPTGFVASASSSDITLSWANPPDSDFVSSIIRRSVSAYPTSISDGSAVTSTTVTIYTDSSLADGTYYYSIFAIDTNGNISIQATSSATIDTYVAPTLPVSSGNNGGEGGGAAGGSHSLTLPSAINIASLFPTTSNKQNNESSPITALPSNPVPTKNAPPTAPRIITRSTFTFTRNLRQGDRGADVKALQVFLNTQGFVITRNGQGSPGKETTYFGEATAKAVKKFQEANKETILKPYNLEKGTGVFGTKMREMISIM